MQRLSSDNHLKKMIDRISSKYRVKVTEVDDDVDPDPNDSRGASFDRHDRTVVFYPFIAQLQHIYLAHEAVHLTTDFKFRERPSARTATLATVFISSSSIHARLPPSYAQAFQLDEVKSYTKGARHSAFIARAMSKFMDPRMEGFKTGAINSAQDALAFAEVTLELLIESQRLVADSGDLIGDFVRGTIYAADAPDHFVALLRLPRGELPPVEIGFPIYDPDVAVNGGVDDLIPKLSAVIAAGIKTAEFYRARARSMLDDERWPLVKYSIP